MRRTTITSLALAVAALTAGCTASEPGASPAAAPATTGSTGPSEAPAPMAVATYRGTLPCADCTGIETELTLFANQAYRLEQTYLGVPEGERPFTSEGIWSTRQGIETDPEATVYVLAPTGSGEPTSFLVLDEQRIEQLDREGRRVEARLDYTLTKALGRPPFD